MRFKWNLTDLTAASHKPPKWGALGGLKFHFIPLLVANFEIVSAYVVESKKVFESRLILY